MTTNRHLFHGGNLPKASKETGIPIENWIDLSTGISPYSYPLEHLASESFKRLPYLDDAFIKSVTDYYKSKYFLAIPGTQAAIQFLPKILLNLPILLPSVGYQEHSKAWQQAGNCCDFYPAFDITQASKKIDDKLSQNSNQHLLVINPNNPSTLRFSPEQLYDWAQKLDQGAYLIVDEAFIDPKPAQSIIPLLAKNPESNIIVLRSFGKYFGLAGIRLGFMFAAKSVLNKLEEYIPLWSINGPALHIARKALSDHKWLDEHRENLMASEQFMISVFKSIESEQCFHEALFSSYILPKKSAQIIFNHFYSQGILLRLIDISEEESMLRIGRLKLEEDAAIRRIHNAFLELQSTFKTI